MRFPMSVLEGEQGMSSDQSFLVEADNKLREMKMKVFDVVLQSVQNGTAHVSLVNRLGVCEKVEKGMDIGMATPVDVLGEGKLSGMQICYSEKDIHKDSAISSLVGIVNDSITEENRKDKMRVYLECGEAAAG